MKLMSILLLSALSVTAWAGFDTETDQNDVILAGHDAVAYQTQGKAVPGQGAIYDDL